MITILNPDGTPSTTYNRDGLTIATISGAGTTQATATAILRHSQYTVVIVDATSGHEALMPNNAEVGDRVEVLAVNGYVDLWPESGGKFYGQAVNTIFNSHVYSGTMIRVDSSTWAPFYII